MSRFDQERGIKPLNTTEGSNRYRFQTFAERISHLDIDVYHKIDDLDLRFDEDVEQGKSSYFQYGLEKWEELNCSAGYRAFVKEVKDKVSSLPQLLFHKKEVVSSLVSHLTKLDLLAVKPLLNLVTLLARDLRQEFYPFFPQVLSVLCELLDPQNAELIEEVFSTISFIFKFCLKQLVKDLANAFSVFLPLLRHPRHYIRLFAGESFSFLLRKVKPRLLPEVYAAMFSHLSPPPLEGQEEEEGAEDATPPLDEELCHGLARLLFESVKNVANSLHSRVNEVFVRMFSLLRPSPDSPAATIRPNIVFLVLRKTVALLIDHVTQDTAGPVFDHLTTLLAESVPGEDPMFYARVLLLLTDVLRYYQGSLVPYQHWDGLFALLHSAILPLMRSLAKDDSLIAPLGRPVFQFLAVFMCTAPPELSRKPLDSRNAPGPVFPTLIKQLVELIPTAPQAHRYQLSSLLYDFVQSLLPMKPSHSSTPRAFSLIRPALAGILDLLASISPTLCLTLLADIVCGGHGKGFELYSIYDANATNSALPEEENSAHFPSLQKVLETSTPGPCVQLLHSTLGLASPLTPAKTPRRKKKTAEPTPAAPLTSADSQLLFQALRVCTRLNVLGSSSPPLDFARLLAATVTNLLPSALPSPTNSDPPTAQPAAVLLVLAVKAFSEFLRASVNAKNKSLFLPAVETLLSPLLTAVLAHGHSPLTHTAAPALPLLLAFAELLTLTHDLAPSSLSALALTLPHGEGEDEGEGEKGEEGSAEASLFHRLSAQMRENLAHADQRVRHSTLRIFRQTLPPSVPAGVLDHMLVLESTQPSVATGRSMVACLQSLRADVEYGRVPAPLMPLVLPHAVGALRIKFAMVYKPVHELVKTLLAGERGMGDFFTLQCWPFLWKMIGLLDAQLSDPAYEELEQTDPISPPSKKKAKKSTFVVSKGVDKRFRETAGTLATVCVWPGLDVDLSLPPAALAARENARLPPTPTAAAPSALYPELDSASVTPNTVLMAPVGSTTISLMHYQYWELLKAIAVVVRRQNRDLVAMFFRFISTEYTQAHGNGATADLSWDLEKEAEDAEEDTPADSPTAAPSSHRVVTAKLTAFLGLFSAFQNPQAFYRSDELKSLVVSLLERTEPHIQKLALTFLTTWKDKVLVEYLPTLQGLIGDDTFRTELVKLRVDLSEGHFLPGEREVLLPVVVRILYAKLLKRSGKRTQKKTMSSRRAAVLSTLGSLQPEEFDLFFQIILRPFVPLLGLMAKDPFFNALEFTPNFTAVANALLENKQRFRSVQPGEGDASGSESESEEDESMSSSDSDDSDIDIHVPSTAKRQRIKGPAPVQLEEENYDPEHFPPVTPAALAASPSRKVLCALANLSLSVQIGFLHLFEEILGQAAQIIRPLLGKPSALVVGIGYFAAWSASQSETVRRDTFGHELDLGQVSRARALAYARLSQLTTAYTHTPEVVGPILPLAAPVLAISAPLLPTEYTQDVAGALTFLRHITENRPLLRQFFPPASTDPAAPAGVVLPPLVALLRTPHTTLTVISAVMDIFEHILEADEANPDRQTHVLTPFITPLLTALHSLLQRMAQAVSQGLAFGASKREVQRAQSQQSRDARRQGAFSAFKMARNRNKAAFARRELALLSKLAPYASDHTQASALVDLLIPFTKGGAGGARALLPIIHVFTPLFPLLQSPERYIIPLSKLFLDCRDPQVHTALAGLFTAIASSSFSNLHPELTLPKGAHILSQLTALSTRFVGETDFDRRLDGYTQLKKEWQLLAPLALTPLLYTLCADLYQEDYGIRSNATHVLTLFIEATAKDSSGPHTPLFGQIVLPALKRAVRTASTVAREETMMLFALLAKTLPLQFPSLVALDDPDAEVSFFNNVAHIQYHRRIRALRRLAAAVQEEKISQSWMQSLALPLASHALHESDKQAHSDMIVAGVEVVEATAAKLSWGPYYATLMNYIRLLPLKPDLQKPLVKTIVAIVRQFHFDMSACVPDLSAATVTDLAAVRKREEAEALGREGEDLLGDEVSDHEEEEGHSEGEVEKEEEDVQMEENREEEEGEEEEEDTTVPTGEEKSGSGGEEERGMLAQRIQKAILGRIVPQLLKHLSGQDKASIANRQQREERLEKRNRTAKEQVGSGHSKRGRGLDILRVPVALAVVSILKVLPVACLDAQLPRLLTTLAFMLRSREEEVRDTVRQTLVSIALELGPRYLRPILEELVNALTRGYQVHVLGFTLHSLLLAFVEKGEESGDSGSQGPTAAAIDQCLSLILSVIEQELFGDVGKQKQITKLAKQMKEVRKSRAYETCELVGSLLDFAASATGFMHSLRAFVMRLPESRKTALILDDALRKFGTGLLRNPTAESGACLDFTFTLTEDSLALAATPEELEGHKLSSLEEAIAERREKFIYQPTPIRTVTGEVAAPISQRRNLYPFAFALFAVRLLHQLLKHARVDLKSEALRPALDRFPPLLLRILRARDTPTVAVALKTLPFLIRLGLPSVEALGAPLSHIIFHLIRNGGDTSSELVQSAFRVLSYLIRENSTIKLTPGQLKVVLAFLQSDLAEHDKHPITFGLLRALIDRSIVAPEIYDLMKYVGDVLIQSHNPTIRQQAANCMILFLVNYPLGSRRLRYHIDHVIKNLAYPHQTGREAALELTHLIVKRFPTDTLVSQAQVLFLPLVLRVANEPVTQTAQLAAVVVKDLLTALPHASVIPLFLLVQDWLSGEKPTLQRCAAQMLGLFIESAKVQIDPHILGVWPHVDSVLRTLLERHADTTGDSEFFKDPGAAGETDWQILYHLLLAIEKIFAVHPAFMFRPVLDFFWVSFPSLLLYSHAWVRSVAARLFGRFAAQHEPSSLSVKIPLKHASPTPLGDSARLFTLLRACATQLNSPFLQRAHGDQAVKNLIFIATVLNHHPPLAALSASIAASSDAIVHEREGEEGEGETHNAVFWLFRRLSFIARSESLVTKTCVFKFFAASIALFGSEFFTPHLRPVLFPLYRTISSPLLAEDSDIKSLAKEVLDLIKKNVDHDLFNETYQMVRSRTVEKKLEGRKRRSELALTNPALTAQKKQKKHKRAAVNKKERRFRKK